MNDFKKIMTVGITVTAALIGTYYIQLFLENTFSNVIFRWSLGWSICLVMAYHATESIIRYLNKNNPSEEWVQSYSVFRIHTKGSTIYGWLVSENDWIKKTIHQEMVGYIPLKSKLGKPEYIPSDVVVRIEFLFVREQPKYSQLKHVVLAGSPTPSSDTMRASELENKLFKDLEKHKLVIDDLSRSNKFNPLYELMMHTSRRFRQGNRLISFKNEVLLDSRTLYTELIVSPSDVVLIETYYFKVIGTNFLEFQLYEKRHELTPANELVIPLSENERLKIPLTDKSTEEFLDEQTKERNILEHTVETLNAMLYK